MNYLTAQFKKSLKSVKGFSLIELMVVISIIAILAVIGAVVYSNVQSRGRDAKRQADVSAIADALESKKDPTIATYASVAAADFSNGVPTDGTSNRVYCFAQSTTKTPPGTPTAWTAPTSAAPCAITSTPTATWADFGTGTVTGTTQSWKICALLENSVGGSTYFCKTSSQ